MMHWTAHNKMTSSKIRKRRALENIRARHAIKADTDADRDGRHRRAVKRYDEELARLGVPV